MDTLNIDFCGMHFVNPLVLGSGILGVTGGSLAAVANSGAGGVTSKTWWAHAHEGHANPVVIAEDGVMLNAVGLPDGGIEKHSEEIQIYRDKANAPFIASIVGGSVQEFEEVAEKTAALKPDILEVNVSCPNVSDEFGDLFSSGCISVALMTKSVKKYAGEIPVTVKLSPNVPNIAEVAKACEDNGADAITAINTVGPGIRINPELRAPILKNKRGGVSGPAILPIAIRCVWDIYEAVKIPIIGIGGVTHGTDAIEMMMAGARLVGVASALHFRGKDAFTLITEEMSDWCKKEGIENIESLIGVAHG